MTHAGAAAGAEPFGAPFPRPEGGRGSFEKATPMNAADIVGRRPASAD